MLRQHELTTAPALQVYQWDMNTGEIVQQYDQHQAAVNTVTFVDDNRCVRACVSLGPPLCSQA